MMEGSFVHKAIKGLGQCPGDLRGSTGAGPIHYPLAPLVREAMDPLAPGSIGQVQRVGHRLEALAFDDLTHGLGTTEDPGFLGLLARDISGGEGLIRQVAFERPHWGVSRKKLRQKFTRSPYLLLLMIGTKSFRLKFLWSCLYQHADDPAGAVGADMAEPFDSGRPERLDSLAVGACESVRDVRAEHARAITTRTGSVIVEATWPKFRPSLPRGLAG